MTHDEMMERIPRWLAKQIGKNGITTEYLAPWWPAVVRIRDGGKYVVWGSVRQDAKCPELQAEGRLIQREIADAKRLSDEEKRALRASKIEQAVDGTGHKPAELLTWREEPVPWELALYFNRVTERGGYFKMRLRWLARMDERLRAIAAKKSRSIPDGVNFIKSERSKFGWGGSGYVEFESPKSDEVRGIILGELKDMNGNKLKVEEKNGRMKISNVHFVYQLFFENGFPIC